MCAMCLRVVKLAGACSVLIRALLVVESHDAPAPTDRSAIDKLWISPKTLQK